jgi:selenocysteine lyase/cysteine desulfurase
MALRDEFPVLERVAYLNAGTDGPIPRAATELAQRELAAELEDGRTWPHFERRMALQADLRAGYARLMNAEEDDVAVTTGTSFGLGCVLAGMDLGPGDELVTSDQEHPGLLGPLRAARDLGATVRMVPFASLADAVGPSTRAVACSHVSWVGGEVVSAELAATGVPVILDGAQGAGAVPVDVAALGCAVYAAAGQKWLCGADGTGMLYVEPSFRERVRPVAPSYMTFVNASEGMDSPLRAEARRFDTPSLSRESAAFSLASLGVLEGVGLDAVYERAAALAATLAERLEAAGRVVAPRGRTTLVSWEDPDPEVTSQDCATNGVVVRNLPGTPYLRASVGAWNDESDLERLLDGMS